MRNSSKRGPMLFFFISQRYSLVHPFGVRTKKTDSILLERMLQEHTHTRT